MLCRLRVNSVVSGQIRILIIPHPYMLDRLVYRVESSTVNVIVLRNLTFRLRLKLSEERGGSEYKDETRSRNNFLIWKDNEKNLNKIKMNNEFRRQSIETNRNGSANPMYTRHWIIVSSIAYAIQRLLEHGNQLRQNKSCEYSRSHMSGHGTRRGWLVNA